MSGLPATARIGFDAVRALRNSTGLGNYARHLLRGLRRAAPGLDLHLYSPSPPRPEFSGYAESIGATVHLPPRGWRTAGLRAVWRTTRLGQTVARDGMALYHGLTHEIPRDLPETGVPSVVTVHDLLFLTHPELFPVVDRQSYVWRYRWSIEHATALVAVSEHTRQELHAHLDVPLHRVVVIPPARDPCFAQACDAPARAAVRARHDLPAEYLIMIGTLEPRKNHRLALEALGQLGAASPPLVLVGRDGGSEAELRSEAQRLGIADRVLVRTAVTDAELPAVLQGATLALYLSRAEGFGMPIIEAMSAGVPMLVAAGPHLRDAAGDAAVAVDPEDPTALAAAIRALLGDPAGRAAIAAAGMHHAAGFDATALARRLLSVYDAVVSGGPLPDGPDPHLPAATPTPPLETTL
ncbi:MAG: glycosyltransferase family 4 protein [Gemmatimonadales bacterium]|nr:glycosyltransferase family 4 protein [Gemmatimonadales bacterium]